MVTFSPAMTSCGGSSSTDGNGDTTHEFRSIVSATTDSEGKATFTPTLLSGVDSVEITLTAPNEEPGSELKVYFSESEDNNVMLVVKDPNANYQTSFITLDIADYADVSSSTAQSLYLESREVLPAGVERDGKSVSITALILISSVLLAATVSGVSWQNKFREVAGTIDPYRLASGEPECFSFDTLLDHFDLTAEALGLMFWTGTTLASAGANLTTAQLYEIVLTEITDSIKDELEAMFWSEVASIALDGSGIDSSTDVCWILRLPDSASDLDYSKILEMRADQACSSASDCDGLEASALDLNDLDGDQDGYSINQNDCDDQNEMIYPGATEICGNGIVENCSLSADPDCNMAVNEDDYFIWMRDYVEAGDNLPDGGSGDHYLLTVGGTFYDAAWDGISEAIIFINGEQKQIVRKSDLGSYNTQVSLEEGYNLIQVVVDSAPNYGVVDLSYTNTGTQKDLIVALTWDECPNLDLHVVEPGGTDVYSGNPTGDDGTLLVYGNNGWGPEIYVSPSADTSGAYQFHAKYEDNGSCGASGYSTAYTLKVITPYGINKYMGTLSSSGEESSTYSIRY